MWYDSTAQKIMAHAAGSSVDVSGGGGGIPILGEITFWGSAEPAGGDWKFPVGQELLIADYTEAYNLLTQNGTVFPHGTNTDGSGNAGSTHFRMPDGRSRTRVQLDDGAGILAGTDAVGATEGTQTVALTPAQTPLKAHTHSGTTGTESASHTHTGTSGNPSADHTHSGTSGTVSTGHLHGFSTGGVSANHYHVPGGGGCYFFRTCGSNLVFASGSQYTLTGVNQNTQVSSTHWISTDHGHSGTTGDIDRNHTHGFTSGGVSAWHTHSTTTGTASVTHTHSFTTGNPSVAEANGDPHTNMQPSVRVNKLVRMR